MNMWKKSFGDSRTFAVVITFLPDPDHGCAVTPEESWSWGALELWVQGQNLCEHIEDGQIMKSVNWYLLPVLEWMARNWDPLLHEQRLPIKYGDAKNTAWASFQHNLIPPIGYDDRQSAEWNKKWYNWMIRHSLLAAREGGLFPDVFIRRYRDEIEISWGEIHLAGAPQGFRFCVPEGAVRLKPEIVSGPLFDMLSSAAQYLKERYSNSGRIASFFQDVQNIPQSDSVRRLSWLAGLDVEIGGAMARWIDVTDAISRYLGDAGKRLVSGYRSLRDIVITGSCDAAMMFGSLSPTIDRDDVLVIARLMIDAVSAEGDADISGNWVRSVDLLSDASPAWEQGYCLAMELHEKLSVHQNDSCVDMGDVLEKLGIRCSEVSLNDGDIRAISLAGPRHKPTILLNATNGTNRYESGRRFTLAHELCHVLYDRAYGVELAMASGPWAPRDIEKRANAFAAMFIMPPNLLRSLCNKLIRERVELQGILRMSSVLKVGVVGVIDHLHNLGFIDENTRERLKEDALSVGNSWQT